MTRRSQSSSRPPSEGGQTQRQLRVGELLRHALADLLLREDLRDPALRGASVTVTEVRVSPDLRHARAYVLPLGGAHAGEAVEGLNRCARFLRGRLARSVELKFSPDIAFVLDESFERARHIDALLKSPEVARDLPADERPGRSDEADD